MENRNILVSAAWPWILASVIFDAITLYCMLIWNHEIHLYAAFGACVLACVLLIVGLMRLKFPNQQLEAHIEISSEQVGQGSEA